jgi:uncharacterized protein YndB with AHSA1/START domain
VSEQFDLILERILDAPPALLWRAWTDPEHIKSWWAPRPYQTSEVEIDLKPGGKFHTRMTGPDDFDFSGTACILEAVENEKIVWTTALEPGYRPRDRDPEDCGGFPFTAIHMFEDAGDGKTRYRAVVLHRNAADRDAHEKMGFHDGWGTCAEQMAKVARELAR